MNIEAELPENFDELSDEEKISELEQLKKEFEEQDESPVKIRMIEELKASYQD
ncbi:hypothetical protein [Candidatus Nanohalovita haloferacivicina]|uniref:hypothetical protein n=1 Tax=Candidatus Nanohalovita haloferacivicina TaxID=2978046 RepID=UPI00325FCD26|nr:hypothetical protein HBNXNv_0402 [Candidatus Nanohalobia archaeon BNXNv]